MYQELITIKYLFVSFIAAAVILSFLWNQFSSSAVKEQPIEPVHVQEKTFTGEERNAVMLSIINGETDKVRAALDDGISPDSITHVPDVMIDLSFLEIAVRKNKPDIVKLLLDKRASLDVRVNIDPKDPDKKAIRESLPG